MSHGVRRPWWAPARRRPATATAAASTSAPAPRQHRQGARAVPRGAPRASGERGGGQQRAAERHREGDQRGAAEGGERGEGRAGVGEGQPAPGEAAEGQPVAGQFLGDPQAGAPQRPQRQPRGRARGRRRAREEERLDDGQADHRVPADDVQPAQQPHEEREPEGEARSTRPAGRYGRGQQGEGGDGDQRERPQVVRREGQAASATPAARRQRPCAGAARRTSRGGRGRGASGGAGPGRSGASGSPPAGLRGSRRARRRGGGPRTAIPGVEARGRFRGPRARFAAFLQVVRAVQQTVPPRPAPDAASRGSGPGRAPRGGCGSGPDALRADLGPAGCGSTEAVVYWASGPHPGRTCRSGGAPLRSSPCRGRWTWLPVAARPCGAPPHGPAAVDGSAESSRSGRPVVDSAEPTARDRRCQQPL